MNPARASRTVLQTLLCIGFALLSAAGWLRFSLSIATWDTLQQVGIQPGPLYLTISGLLWGACGLLCALALWFNWRAARQFGVWGTVIFFVSYWADRLFFTQAAPSQSNWAFALILSAFGVFSGFFILYTLQSDRPAKNLRETSDEPDSARD